MDQKSSEALTFYNRKQDFLEVRLDAEKFPRLQDIADTEALPQIRAMIVGASILRNRPLSDTAIDLMAGAFLQEVRQDFPGLTLPEIGKAIRNGCFEKYGEVYGLSAVAFYKMVVGYTQSEEADEIRRKEVAARTRQREKQEAWNRSHPDYFLGNMVDNFAKEHQI